MIKSDCSAYVLNVNRDSLASFPYVKVRLGCRKCSREGSYSLARLADKDGANVKMDDLLRMLVGDCKKLVDPRHRFADRCGAYFVDLDWAPKPPDLPTRDRAEACQALSCSVSSRNGLNFADIGTIDSNQNCGFHIKL